MGSRQGLDNTRAEVLVHKWVRDQDEIETFPQTRARQL